MSDLVSSAIRFPKEQSRSVGLLLGMVGLAVALAIRLLSIKTGVFDAMSTDDIMRLVEVRDLINGQAWSDLRQYRLDPPGVLMHWSRLIDLPLAASILLLKPLIGMHDAEAVTLFVWPLLLFVAALALIMAIARLMSNGAPTSQISAAVLTMLAAPALVHFRPGAIDHHSAQIDLLLSMLVFALQIERSAIKAALAGLSASLSLAIGLEMLPAIATISVAVTGLFIWRGAPVARQVAAFAGALAASSLGFALALLPSQALASPVCDALGGPLLLSIVGGSVGLILMVAIDRCHSAIWLRLISAAGSAAALAATAIWLFAGSLAAPYAQLDPLVVSLWLDNVQETTSLATMLRLGPEEVPGFYAFPVLTLGIAIVTFFRSNSLDRFRWVLGIATLASLAAISVWEMRGTGGAAMVAAPIFSAAAAVLWPSFGTNLVLLAFLVSPVTFATLGTSAKPLIDLIVRPQKFVFESDASSCRSISDVAAMRQLPHGRVMAPIDLGPAILAETDHVVFAAPYHRNNNGNLAMLKLMLAPAPVAHQMLLEHQVDYVLICRTSPNRNIIERAPDGLEARLVRGETPEYLEPMNLGSTAKIAAWRLRTQAPAP